MASSSALQPRRSLRARVRTFIVEHQLFAPAQRVLVGVSGGADSTCLLLTLASLRRSLKLDLHAAHFDHKLRGVRAAQAEQRFVRCLCEALDVPFHTGSGDVRAHAKKGKRSIEEAARELRYRFLARVARANGCDTVAVGHTRDDQAETVLLRLLRGSGLRGLAAMSADAPWPLPVRGEAPRLVRPLLAISREETEACCREAGLQPVDDPSNRSPRHLRNRVRSELLPELRRYNPRIDDALVRLANSAAGDVELLESLAAEAVEQGEDGSTRIPRRRFAALPPSLQRHAVRIAGGRRELSDRHVRAVVGAAAGPTGARLELPRGLRVRVGRDAIVFSTDVPKAQRLPDGEVALPVPGRARIGQWRLEAAIAAPPSDLELEDGVYLDAATCGDRLTIRRRRPGDRYQPQGRRRPKKLQDVLVDAHVPREERDALPVVVAGDRLAWVAGRPPAEWAKVTRGTKSVVRLTAGNA